MWRTALLVLALALAGAGCGKEAEPVASDQAAGEEAGSRERIALALERLLTRDWGAFVIIEVEATGDFVQFAGSTEQPLLMDVPVQSLSEDEQARARQFFEGAGLGAFDDDMQSFMVELGRDPEAAAETALRALRDIFDAPADAALEIREE